MAVSAVIAAAGLSARMRDFKPLLCLGSSTVIRHTIDALRGVGAEDIVVVTGYQCAVLERHLFDSGVMFLKNERFAQTDMLTSLQLGLAALPSGVEKVFVTPADVPLVSGETLEIMLGVEAQVVQPLCRGKGGHPLLLRTDAMGAIAASVAGITIVVLGWLGVSLPSLGGFFPCIPSAIAFVIVSLIAPDKAKA